jgi:catechol 2,3-dioxygenase-like lactoylglutathione lyase family enzyme
MNRGVLAIHSVHRFDLAVPDLALAESFYRAFGLDVQRDADELRAAAANGHAVLHAVTGERKKLLGLVLGVYEADLPRFAEHLVRCDVRALPAPNGQIRFRDPDGTLIDLVAAPKTSPDGADTPPARTQAPKRSAAAPVQPSGLSHLLLFSADVSRSVAFYSQVLGLRLSDRSDDDIAFMHTPHGSDHHLVAFVRSDGSGLHHSSWRVRSLDEVGLGAMQMAAHGYARGWGVGRHVLGSNYFHYVRDPWGGWAEYSFDMDYIPAGTEWPAANHDGEDAFYVWGPLPPPEFTVNTELA